MTLAAPRTGPGPSLRGWACETAAEGEGGGRRHQGGLEGLGGSPPQPREDGELFCGLCNIFSSLLDSVYPKINSN